MNALLLADHWAALVRDFKDAEKQHDISGYDAERLARYVLDYARSTRIRQYNLFTQKRGEEFERMYERARDIVNEEALKRFLDSDELWKTTLELAELS